MSNEDTQTVLIRLLLPADSPRLVGEDQEHIRLLAESDVAFPPILVHRATMRVIDGMHRLAAARLRGQEDIEVKFYDGSDAEAFVLAVQANVTHGLPLSFADRESAVTRIIESHPHWSDRAISAVTGLGAKTVAAIRRRTSPVGSASDSRIGLDGRVRPLSGAEGRRVASGLIKQRPDVSLRDIARAAGISPTTARDVRERMRRGEDPVPPRQRTAKDRSEPTSRKPSADGEPRPVVRDTAAVLQNLKTDPSLRFTDSGRALLRWLFRHTVGPDDWPQFVTSVPPHCAYVVAALARAWATEWIEFAKQLEQRVLAHPTSPKTA